MNDFNYEVVNGRPVVIDRPQNIDDDVDDMLECYYGQDPLEAAMYENGVSWSDFI